MAMVQWILRIGIFGTFLGHGVYALVVKEEWVKYSNTVGFDTQWAYTIMPIIGGIDILLAITVLIKPLKPILIYAAIWAFATALIRPLSGKPVLEFVERSANWAAPLALLLLLRHQKEVF